MPYRIPHADLRESMMTADDDESPKTEWGTPLRSYEIPGGLTPKKRPPVRVPKRSDYERGGSEDRAGNRGH